MLYAFLFGFIIAFIDAIMLSIVKIINLGNLNLIWMIIPTIIYAIQPWLFLKSLNYESLTIMNLTWDVLSGILVSIVGVFLFHEFLTNSKKLGILTAFLTLFLFSR